MTILVSLMAFLRGPFARAVAAVPRPVWFGLAGIIALLLIGRWHDGKVAAAFAEGGRVRAAVDRARFEAAGAAAAGAQAALADALAARQSLISKGTDDALRSANDDLARRYDDLRLRWAAVRADQGPARQGGATAVPGAAFGTDLTACAAQGWVSFDTAAAAAQAADRAIAKDDAWIAWVTAQQQAWPR